MNILGLSLGILSTAALSRGNKIIACASEERFSRLKNDEAFPDLLGEPKPITVLHEIIVGFFDLWAFEIAVEICFSL